MSQTQTPSTRYTEEGDYVDYVPGSQVYGGDVVLLGNLVMIATEDIASGGQGALAKEGVFKVPKKSGEAWAVVQAVYWDPVGNPVTGTAGTGAFTTVPNQYYAGYAFLAALSGDANGYLVLNEETPRARVTPTGTVAAAGSVQGDAALVPLGFTLVTGADATKGVILPPAVAGVSVEIKNADAANAVLKIWPAAGDAINAIAVNGAFSIAAKTSVTLRAFDATTWYSIPLLPS